jgi:hypothetical protein
MISLILPKLIRSVARVGIWAFNKWLASGPDRWLLLNDTRQERRVQARTCRNPSHLGGFANKLISNLELSLFC